MRFMIFVAIPSICLSAEFTFPFGVSRDTIFSEKSFQVDFCYMDDKDSLSSSCPVRGNSKYDLKLNGFHANQVTFNVNRDSSGAPQRIYDMTLMEKNLECNDVPTAKASIIDILKSKYGEGASIVLGDKFSSSFCKDFMEEGPSKFVLKKENWAYTVDSFYSDGGYYVYVSYAYIPRKQKTIDRRLNKSKAMTADALNKM